ncbi:MAG: hypothetical protein EBE86_031060 [Hormoscilla sp. GUM202]|nr:hypothetical protein [Hormoscilla sp. GUM202]
MCTKEVLSKYETNPQLICSPQEGIIQVNPSNGSTTTKDLDVKVSEGGKVTAQVVKKSDVEGGLPLYHVDCKYNDAGASYYYPWLKDGGVGYCCVPTTQLPKGTLVLTPPMNGCVMKVYLHDRDAKLLFCHDADGKYLSKVKTLTQGYKELFSISSKDLVTEEKQQELEKYNSTEYGQLNPKYWMANIQACYAGNNKWYVQVNVVMITKHFEPKKPEELELGTTKCKSFSI